MAVIIFLTLLLQIVLPGAPTPASRQNRKPEASVVEKKSSEPHYVGSQVCAECHMQIYDDYAKTGMGRSMSLITPQLIHDLRVPVSVSDDRTGRNFKIYLKDGKLYESESGQNSSGENAFRATKQITWIIGAGADAYGAIVKRGNYLFEAPLSYYTRAQAWAPSPGYEKVDLTFNRPALEGCIYCHSGRANPVAGTNGEYKDPAFQQLRIGCENCHGPGSAHVALMTSGNWMKAHDLKIVNPAKLSPTLANNLCEGCHEIGDERVLQPGKSYLDIRPGQPLNKYLAIFIVPPKKGSPPPTDHLEQYYEITLSKCYRASGGKLRCITCHDPHIQLTAAQAPAYFNSRCMTCHTVHSCTLPLTKRMKEKIPDNCIGCHMPQRQVTFLAHTALTDHRILAYPGEPMPDSAFHQTTAAIPDLIDMDPAPGKKDAPQPLLTMLKAYGRLAANYPGYNAAYLRVLKEASVKQPDNPLVQAALGRKALKAEKFKEAADHLEFSLKLEPTRAVTYADLSTAMQGLGEMDKAVEAQQEAVQHDPYNPILQKRLIVLYIHGKQYADAESAMKKYVKTFPQDLFMRHMLVLAEGQ